MGREGLIQQKRTDGFTIIELLLATAVFSAVILVALSGFLGVGRIFYKGITITQTDQTTSDILKRVTDDIHASDTFVSKTDASSGRSYLCLGNIRYTFILHKQLVSPDFDSNFGLLRDRLPGNSGCGNPFDDPKVPLYQPTELLSTNMRLNTFDITKLAVPGSIFSIDINVASGDSGSLDVDSATQIASCNSNLSRSQNCAVSHLKTTIAGGI